jgi:hypothetical protein
MRQPCSARCLHAGQSRPHWYLGYLGTRRDKQGEGLGTQMLRAVLAHVARTPAPHLRPRTWCCPPQPGPPGHGCVSGILVISSYQLGKPLSYRGCMTAWGNLPSAMPPHGTVLAWARGCRCDECEREYQRFVSELALRGPLRLPAQPEPRKLDADTLARLEPAVSQSECPVCGALRHQRCHNLAFPQHFAPTHPERRSG